VHDVNQLLKQFRDMQKLMKQFSGARPGRFGIPGPGR
jgi:signal recognition particle GTPase